MSIILRPTNSKHLAPTVPPDVRIVNSANATSGPIVAPAPEAVEKRPVWDNQVQFILSTIGLSVGLGNVWKFPSVAFDNGGSAFLFPYLLCAVFFALPLIYMEFIIGQYTSSSPALAFRKYAPAFEGLGWAMSLMCGQVAIFYTLIIAWAGVYMGWIVAGQHWRWTRCDNDWNSFSCQNSSQNFGCNAVNASAPYWNGTMCIVLPEKPAYRAAAEEFFTDQIVKKSSGFGEFGTVQWQTLVALVVLWCLVYLIVIKGIKYIGYAAYVTSTVPYLIIAIMFVRAITLEGATDGIYYYLGAPEWTKILNYRTWLEAVKQILFSLSIGFGALSSLASYSKRNNNCLRDALILIAGDTIMSVFGGVAVFATLGYMAKRLGKNVRDVVTGGPALVFVVYPEALSSMPWDGLWAFLFFLMLLLLGLSSEIAIVDVQCSSIYDQFPRARKYDWLVSLCVCLTYFLLGAIFATGTGWYWFNIASTFAGSTGTCIIVALEAIVIGVVYGIKNYQKDQISMFGPPTNWFSAYFGPTSLYWGLSVAILCPILALVVGGALTYEFIGKGTLTEQLRQDDGTYVEYKYPALAMFFGWFLNLAPLLAIPIVFAINWSKYRQAGMTNIMDMLRIQKEHPSYARSNGVEVLAMDNNSISNSQASTAETPAAPTAPGAPVTPMIPAEASITPAAPANLSETPAPATPMTPAEAAITPIAPAETPAAPAAPKKTEAKQETPAQPV